MSPKYPFTRYGINTHAYSSSGVYAIYADGVWLYVGKSSDMRARLLEHESGASDQSGCIKLHGANLFSFEVQFSPERERREDELIRRYNPICNR